MCACIVYKLLVHILCIIKLTCIEVTIKHSRFTKSVNFPMFS